MGELAVIEERALTAVEVRSHVNLIQEVMSRVMKEETHYGVIPGTKKPSLWKAGSEVLLTTFRIAVDPEIEDLSTHDEIRYRLRVHGVHQGTGVRVGTGVGECSSNEEKYKWRRAICPEEWAATDEARRRVKYGRAKRGSSGPGFYTEQQVRTDPADQANTILKMAKKRGQIDMTLTATGASDCFTQDLEEMESQREAETEEQRPPIKEPKRKSESKPASTTAGTVTEGQVKVIRANAEKCGLVESAVCTQFQVGHLEEIDASAINDVLEWIEDNNAGADVPQ